MEWHENLQFLSCREGKECGKDLCHSGVCHEFWQLISTNIKQRPWTGKGIRVSTVFRCLNAERV